MAYVAPTTRSTGFLVTAAVWNQDIVANAIAAHAGEVALTSQVAQDFIIASSATQLDRIDQAGLILMTQVFD